MDAPRKINGMQKFYSKLLHKIEDFPPKLKLSKAVAKEDSKSGNKDIRETVFQVPAVSSIAPTTPQRPPRLYKRRSASSDPPYVNVLMTNQTASKDGNESDTDNKLKVCNNSSLEDEIFEELEKVAHDEAKLNAVIQNFDKILFDYKDRNIPKVIEQPKCRRNSLSNAQSTTLPLSLPLSVATGPSSLTNSQKTKPNIKYFVPKPLQKAKTCSIIESKCILKKDIGLSDQFPTKKQEYVDELDKYVQMTKSLMSLHDLNELAQKLDREETERLRRDAINFNNYNTYKVTKQTTIAKAPVEIKKSKALLCQKKSSELSRSVEKLPIYNNNDLNENLEMTKTKSVCELSRNNSGLSKIPIKSQLKNNGPQMAIVKPMNSSRSNSFLNDMRVTTSISTRNLNYQIAIPIKPLASSSQSFQNLTSTVNAIQSKSIVNKRGIMKSAVSTNAINKSSYNLMNNKNVSVPLPSSKPGVKAAVSDMSLNKSAIKRFPVETVKKIKDVDMKNGEKRFALLKKTQEVKANVNQDKVDLAHISVVNVSGDNGLTLSAKRDILTKFKKPILTNNNQTSKSTTVIAINGSRSNTSHNKVKHSNSLKDSKTNAESSNNKNISPPKPRTRHTLSNINITNQKPQKDEIIEKTKIPCEPNSNDKAYQSDCSDDSGHISNEADDNIQLTQPIEHAKRVNEFVITKCNSNNKKTGRISDASVEKLGASNQTTIAGNVVSVKNVVVGRNQKNQTFAINKNQKAPVIVAHSITTTSLNENQSKNTTEYNKNATVLLNDSKSQKSAVCSMENSPEVSVFQLNS